jgi:parvulin-like peptidyl-prolyl isomerase
MMQTMRNSAKIVFFLVLVAFAGFMILQGLLSIFGKSAPGGEAPPQGVVGIVNGQQITIREFENLYRPRAQALYQEEEEPSDEELSRIRDDIWNQLTIITNLYIEASKHNIEITDAEVAEYMKLTPPQDLMTVPEFQTEEKFDLSKYQTWLQQVAASNNPEMVNFLHNFESQIRQQIMISRLQNLVASMVRITPNQAKEDFVSKNEKVKVKFILFPEKDFESEQIEIPDSAVLARYEADKENYKKQEQAIISYVTFPKRPSDNDYNELKGYADSLYKRAISGEDFGELAKEYSDDTGSAKKDGDVDWFGEGKMVEPFYEATKNLKEIGDISEPVKSQFGWHIIKLTGRREVDIPPDSSGTPRKKTEYRASHILVSVEASNATLSQIQSRADNFVQDARDNGFDESAGDFGLTVTQTKPFTSAGYIPGLGPVRELTDFAFNSDSGAISEAITTGNAFLVARLDQIIPESYRPLEEVRDGIVQRLQRERRVDLAYQRADELENEIKSGKTLDQIAQEIGKTAMESDYFARGEMVNIVGNDAAFTGAAFGLAHSEAKSAAVKSINGAYILELVDYQPADTTQFTAKADSLTQDLLVSKRQDAWNRWVRGLMQDAEIKDYRSYYYGT